MISYDQLDKALRRQRVSLSPHALSALLNELQPNPVCGFGCGGVQIWGDEHSVNEVRHWHHDSTAVVPSLRRVLADK